MRKMFKLDGEWCRANLGQQMGPLPQRPSDGRCELCEQLTRKRLLLDPSGALQRTAAPHRGWVCGACGTLLQWIDEIGPDKLFD